MLSFLFALIYFAPPRKVSELECNETNFNYVVELKTYERVCFGSSAVRETGFIGKGLSPQQKRLTPENNPRTGPGHYNIDNIKCSFKKVGFRKKRVRRSSAVSRDQRRMTRPKTAVQTPTIIASSLGARFIKKSSKPFGVGAKIRHIEIPNMPGPADYNLQNFALCQRRQFQYNFGRPSRGSCVDTICVNDPTDTCHLCGKLCEGEYWHQNHTKFLCQLCLTIELATKEFYSLDELKQYRKMRNCSFVHQHEKTTAALTILERNKLKKKLDIENYLDFYIKCF